jgi:DNA integrity scanning protein DisA with diadenylate cyclase activity
MFVVGDSKKVMENSHPAVHDPFKGYSRKERNIKDRRVRESIKELAQLDGAFVIDTDGVVVAGCRILDSAPVSLTLTKGLGARHWAAAAISKNTRAIAVVVSESSGTVRLFQNGEVVLRIEPFRRAMKWKEFEYEPPGERAE